MKTKLCRPVLVPISLKKIQPKDCIGKIFLNKDNVASILTNIEDIIKSNSYFKAIPQELILISLDPEEKIEVDKLHLNVWNNEIITMDLATKNMLDCGMLHNPHCKIIATQCQLPQEYIQQIVEQFNSGKVEDIEIEIIEDYGHIDKDYDPDDQENAIFIGEYLKLNDENQIQIVKRKPILYTEEEVKELLLKSVEETCTKHKVIQQIFKDNLSIWFEQNKKK